MASGILTGQVTGIGSLPHRDPAAAIGFVAEWSPAIPFWPQLPQRAAEESMTAQMLAPVRDLLERYGPARFIIAPGRLGEFLQGLEEVEACLDTVGAAGFFAFEHACHEAHFPTAAAFKGQITGPITLAHCLFIEDRSLVDVPESHVVLARYLCRLGRWQIERLRQFGLPVIIFVDEPTLGLRSVAPSLLAGLGLLVGTLQRMGAQVGSHCCAAESPATLCNLRPDIMSFDGYHGLEMFLDHAQVRRFVGEGGWLALGLVPTFAPAAGYRATDMLIRLAVAAGEDLFAQLAGRCLVTATCGVELLKLTDAAATFRGCHELSARYCHVKF